MNFQRGILDSFLLLEGEGKIRKTLLNNGSPSPIFKTDDERSYFLTILKAHPGFQVEAQVEAQVELTEIQIRILSECAELPISKRSLAEMLGHSDVSGSLKRAVAKLIENKLLDYTVPDKPRSRLQRYRTTEKGRTALRILKK